MSTVKEKFAIHKIQQKRKKEIVYIKNCLFPLSLLMASSINGNWGRKKNLNKIVFRTKNMQNIAKKKSLHLNVNLFIIPLNVYAGIYADISCSVDSYIGLSSRG